MGVWLKGKKTITLGGKAVEVSASWWPGGRIAEGNVYHLDKTVQGVRYAFSLGDVGEEAAQAELADFLRNPSAYKPPKVREAEDAHVAVVKPGQAVIVTDKLLEEFGGALLKGYDEGRRKARSEQYVGETLHYLASWFIGEDVNGKRRKKVWKVGPLKGRDMRLDTVGGVQTSELRDMLKGWDAMKQKRVAAIKTFAAWLRFKGLLSSRNDPTLDLKSLPTRKPSPDEKEARYKSPEYLAELYRHLDRPETRDPFLVRAMTGLHVSELRRFAEGTGTLVPYTADPNSEIAGKVRVLHKIGKWHTQTVTRQVFEALLRLRKRGTIPISKVMDHCLTRAYAAMAKERGCPVEKVETMMIADLRLCWETACEDAGRVVYHEGKAGVARSIIQQTMGHSAGTATTKDHYNASMWPALVIPPFALVHPDDPPLTTAGERHLRVVV